MPCLYVHCHRGFVEDEQVWVGHEGDGETETWEILITCADEKEQRALLKRLQKDGVTCRALVG